MFRNYLVTALRNAVRHKLYSFINIAGLAVALVCAIFIILFIRDELSYDTWIPDSKNVYRVETTISFPGSAAVHEGDAPLPASVAMQAQIPEVEAQARLHRERMTIKVDDRQFSEVADIVDPGFFQVVKLPLVEGDPATVFAQPESAVLSQTMARKYFGDIDPVGRTITVNGRHPLTVTGVMRDLPHNTQFAVDVALPFTSAADPVLPGDRKDWLELLGSAYVKLVPGAAPNVIAAKTKPILDRSIDVKKDLLVNLHGSQVLQFRLTRLSDVHLESDVRDSMAPRGSRTLVYGFAAIAVLILSIACFNFTNLATARAMMRAREVSLRKTMGARRKQLIAQFLGESVFTALIAMVFALAMVEMLLPAYDAWLDRPIAFHYLADWPLALGIFAIAVFAGLLSGVYPAFVLSGFRPAATLKASAGWNGAGVSRVGLVVLQFAISIGLGIAALVVFAQIRHARQLDLGFNRSNMVVLQEPDPLSQGATPLPVSARDSLARALASDPNIAGVTQSDHDGIPFSGNETSPCSVPGNPRRFTISPVDITPEFPVTYGMRLLAGRLLSRDRGSDVSRADFLRDKSNILVNAAAAHAFGFTPTGAVGRTIVVAGTRVTVVGVLQDALFRAAETAPTPTMYYFNPRLFDVLSIRVKSGHIHAALAVIDRTWQRFAPTVAVRRFFLDDRFDRLLVADKQQGAMFGIFVGIAIFIACLGLFGLAAFTTERRTKEIGVRKAFGARTGDIVRLLLWQFSIPVLIANVVAWPVAWYYLHNWLESYAYRISLSPLYFVAVGAVALMIAWVTVIAHAIRVARANPVHALRYE